MLELADYANALAYTHSAIGLALTCQAQGAPHEAAAVVAGAQTHLRQQQLDQMLEVTKRICGRTGSASGTA